jgi:hypothetical protein
MWDQLGVLMRWRWISMLYEDERMLIFGLEVYHAPPALLSVKRWRCVFR